jgi:undecaprenyl-diphosphatase
MTRAADGTAEMDAVTTALVDEPVAASLAERRDARPCLHCHPPATPASFYQHRRPLLVAIGALFAFLGAAAAIHNAWLPLRWDEPIQRFVEANRTEHLDTFFLFVSRFGSTMIVLSVGAFLALLTWGRCRAVSIAILAATLGRPIVEFLLKALVGRDRPDLERMVNGHGPSFPSGHVMASVALWGLLPLVVGLFTRSRVIWWISVAFSGSLILAIAASRVYLGVHWFSDVVGGLLLGSFFLLAIEAVLGYVHRINGCGAGRRHAAAAPDRVS